MPEPTWTSEDGQVQLYLGDCLEILPTLEVGSVDAVVTDPPYGVNLGIGKDMRGNGHGLAKQQYASYEDTYENFITIIVPAIETSLSMAKRGAVFAGPHLQDLPKTTTMGGIYHPAACGLHCWGRSVFFPILLYGKDPDLHNGARHTVLRSTATAEKNGHPCPKPLEWMLWLVERTTLPGEVVLDPFMGSGTTGVACVQTGRRFVGIEIEEKYFNIAVKRISEAKMQLRMELS